MSQPRMPDRDRRSQARHPPHSADQRDGPVGSGCPFLSLRGPHPQIIPASIAVPPPHPVQGLRACARCGPACVARSRVVARYVSGHPSVARN